MYAPRDYHTKSDKDKYHMISLISESNKIDTNELVYKIKTDSQTSETNLLPKARQGWEG